MKIITKNVPEYELIGEKSVNMYVTDSGIEFDNEEECKDYEYKDKQYEIYGQIDFKMFGNTYFYKVKNEEELNALMWYTESNLIIISYISYPIILTNHNDSLYDLESFTQLVESW